MTPKSVYAVEVSGACNLESYCSWCPMHTRPRNRPRGLMEMDNVERAIKWTEKLGAFSPIALHNFGEPLLHPEFDTIAERFSRIAPITVSTNAVLLDEKWADRLAKIKWEWISISTWKRDAVERAIKLLTERDIPFKVPPGITHNWAGQSEGPKDVKLIKGCHFLDSPKAIIHWNGDVATCCINDSSDAKIGHVSQEPEEVHIKRYSMCDNCHHAVQS